VFPKSAGHHRQCSGDISLYKWHEPASFEENRLVYDAVERCLERISEAAAKLGDMAPWLMPDQPWQKIRSFGNVLRHEYDAIREDRLFEIVTTDLPGLCAAA
jgi:uncharacterized protein with HEPN domain